MGRLGSPLASSIELPTAPAAAASPIASAAALGSSAPPFSRSTLTGNSVASTMTRQFSINACRVTAVRPSILASPRLVVASASKPIAASSFAVPASQGLGMMKARGRRCSARNNSAFSSWVRIEASFACAASGPISLFLASDKSVNLLDTISFLHGRGMDSDALNTFPML
jgi:hypothetical protein